MRLRTASRKGVSTPELPVPYRVFSNAGLHFRRGQVSLTVAAPGVGKSMLWQNIAERMQEPSLYWSADTDAYDVLRRSTCLWSGHTSDEVEQNHPEQAWSDWYDERLASGAHVDWVFDSVITAKVLAERMNAHAELRGKYPSLVVADNLSNSVSNPSDERAEQIEFITNCQELARVSGSHIAILAHAKGEYDTGMKPIPLSGVYNNLSKVPSVVLTLHRQNDNGSLLGLNIAKNRGGRADPAARHAIGLEVDYARATVRGFR